MLLIILHSSFIISSCTSVPEARSPRLERMRLGGVDAIDRKAAVWLVDGRSNRSEDETGTDGADQFAGRTLLVLQGHPFFRRVVRLREVPGNETSAALAETRRQKMDTLLVLRLVRYQASFAGHTGHWWSAAFLWWYAWFPSWWVADERFELRIEVDAEVWAGATRVASRRLTGRAEGVLDDFDRGWILWGVWRVPGALGRGNWERVAGLLGPAAEAELHDDLARFLTGDLRAALESKEE